jgi:hypothetical protein
MPDGPPVDPAPRAALMNVGLTCGVVWHARTSATKSAVS